MNIITTASKKNRFFLKSLTSKLWFGILIFLFISFKVIAQVPVVVNSDIQFTAIPNISLTDYKSVQTRDIREQNPDLALGIAVSGGGSRAEYFGLGVFLGLEQIKNLNGYNLLNEVDYYSTVSGGSLAAGYYLTIKKNLLLNHQYKSFNEFWLSKQHIGNLQEYLWQSAKLNDFIWNFGKYERNKLLPMPTLIDQQLLQYNPDPNSNKFKQRMILSDFFIDRKTTLNPTLPIFVANGTIFTSVERLPFMPHILKELHINRSLLPEDNSFMINPSYNFPLTYAISGSAAFPGVLPQVKLGLASSNKVIRVVDGGVVENLGYKTLIELLACDDKVQKPNKRAIFIDCAALGEGSRFGNPEIEKRFDVLKSALLFTVDSKYVTRDEDIRNYLIVHDIPKENYCILGFNAIKNTVLKADSTKDKELSKLREYLRQDTGTVESEKASDNRWLTLFNRFQDSVINHCHILVPKDALIDNISYNNNLLRTIDFITLNDFQNFHTADFLMLYELASQIETKMKIYKVEKLVLVLAGKCVVYLNKAKLADLQATN